MDVRRLDIYIAHLGKPKGVRPVLIIQNDKGNAHSTSYIAALITSKDKKPLPTHLVLDKTCGLRKKSTVLCEELVTVQRDKLHEYVGTIVNTEYEEQLNNALEISLQLNSGGK